MGFELNGSVQDLNFFSYADRLDLQEIIKSPDKSAVQKIFTNLSQMKDSGLISIDGSIARITDKGKKLLNSDIFKLASKGAAEKSLAVSGGVPGTVFVVTKKIVQAAVKAAQSISQ